MKQNSLILLFTLGFVGACKKDSVVVKSETLVSQSFDLASGTGEINRTAEFFKNAWDTEFVLKLEDLPMSAATAEEPYSGYWYPESKGGTNDGYNPYSYTPGSSSPLVKYDQAFYGVGQFRASAWEAYNHSRRNISWAGHCNGFSSASVRHKEPEKPVIRNGVTFQPTDIKALLSEIYMSADYFFLGGVRCNGVTGVTHPDQRMNPTKMDACEDVNPGTFHTALANWVGLKKLPIIFDQSQDDQVWNYPLYGYQATMDPISEADALAIIGSSYSSYVFNPDVKKLVYVKNKITYAAALSSEAAPAGAIPQALWLEYILEIDADGRIVGGEWASASRKTHPDFIWVPLDPIQSYSNSLFGNPYLNIEEVLEMWAESAGYPSLAAAPKLLSSKEWAGDWGHFKGLTFSVDGAERGVVFISDKNILTVKLDGEVSGFELEVDGQEMTPSASEDDSITFEVKPVLGLNKLKFSWRHGATAMNDYTFVNGMW